MNKQFMTTTELAREFELDQSTIRRWIWEGKIKSSRTLGDRGKFMIPIDEVVRLRKEYHRE